jgi:hypothetical protein
MPTTTATPTAVPPAELIEQATRVIDIWNSLGPLMAILFVLALAMGVVLLVTFANRNSSATAITVLAQANAQKDKDLLEAKEQRNQERVEFIKGLTVIADQSTRANDLFEAMNSQGGERVKQQQRMVETQDKISVAFETLLREGSTPLQKVASDVAVIMNVIGGLNTRTENWQTVMDSIPQIRADFNERLDSLFKELAKRSTKPIPIVPPEAQPEASPQ